MQVVPALEMVVNPPKCFLVAKQGKRRFVGAPLVPVRVIEIYSMTESGRDKRLLVRILTIM